MKLYIIFFIINIFPLFAINIVESEKIHSGSINILNDFLEERSFDKNIIDFKLFTKNQKLSSDKFILPKPKLTSTQLTPLNREIDNYEINHLLNRTIIGHTIEEIDTLSNLELSVVIEFLLRDLPSPESPGQWVDDPFPLNYFSDFSVEQKDSLENVYELYAIELYEWWVDLIYYNPTSLVDQMTLFWHDHFATSIETVIYTPAMYHQIKTLRENALGNFKDLVTLMTFDPAMMVWLDNNENTAEAINENFARELLELFTMGEGNYTQQDVIEAARGLTGYETDGLNVIFNNDRFDNGYKSFLGQNGNFDSFDIIDIIFEQPQTAYFISEKIYKWFVYENPNEVIVEELAQVLIDNNFEIKPVLFALFTSEHFYDENFYGSKYKDPLTHSLGVLRKLYSDIDQTIYFQNQAFTFYEILRYVQNFGGQLLLYPPDVSGWPGYRNWINTFTLPNRKLFTNYLINGTLGDIVDMISLAEKIPDGLSNPDSLLEYLYTYLFSIEPSELTKQNLMDELLSGTEPSNWHLIYYEGADERFNSVLQRMMRLSEFQLK